MTNKTIKSTIAALALIVLATSGGTASAGVGSITLGNLSTVAVEAGESEIASTKVGYRRHRGHRRHHGRHGGWGGRGYGHSWGHGGGRYGCREVRRRFRDGYGYYYYRFVTVCR